MTTAFTESPGCKPSDDRASAHGNHLHRDTGFLSQSALTDSEFDRALLILWQITNPEEAAELEIPRFRGHLV
jgi:hypothetical protein